MRKSDDTDFCPHRNFKFLRLSALNYILQNLKIAPVNARIWPESLALGAFVVHSINALHQRPDDYQMHRNLLDVVTYHVRPDNPNGDETQTRGVGYEQGLFFAADMATQDKVWRLIRTARFVNMDIGEIPRLYGFATIGALERGFGHYDIKTKGKVHPNRVSNRRAQTDAVELLRPEVTAEEQIPEFNLHASGVQVTPRLAIEGNDIDIEVTLGDNDTCNVDVIMTSIWRQAPIDIFKTSPNRKRASEPPHTLLSSDQRDAATWSVFQSMDMTDVFGRAYIYQLNPASWAQMCDYYFPPKSAQDLHARAQNWTSMTYLSRWKDLMQRVNPGDAAIIRKEVLRLFSTMKWMPHAKAERLWETKKAKSGKFTYYPEGSQLEPAPHIAVNHGLVRGEAIVIGAHVTEEDEEDEEDDA